MIRRPHLAVAAVLATSLVVSSCTTFTDNGNAARVGDVELSTSDVATLVRNADSTGESEGAFLQADPARAAITTWVRVVVLETENGVAADEASSVDNLDSRLANALTALASENLEVAADVYGAGPATSGAICLGAIPLESADQGAEVLAAIEAGTPFADAAATYSADPGLASNGGNVTDDNGSECVSSAQLSPTLAAQLEDVAVGTPVQVALEGLDAVIVVRPFDTLSDDAKRDVALITNSTTLLPGLVGDADIRIDSRYGFWDPAIAEVVPFGG